MRRSKGTAFLMLLPLLLFLLQHANAQGGVIDSSQYVAGPRQRAARAAPRKQTTAAATASNSFAVAPTVTTPGAPVQAPAAPPRANTTSAAQGASLTQTLQAPVPAPAAQPKAAAQNTTKTKVAPANRYQTAFPKSPPQAAKALTGRKTRSRAPAPGPSGGARQNLQPASSRMQPPTTGAPQLAAAAPQEARPVVAPSTTGATDTQGVATAAPEPVNGPTAGDSPATAPAAQLQPAVSPSEELQVLAVVQAPVLVSSFLQAAAPVPAVAASAEPAPGPLEASPVLAAAPASLLQSAALAPAAAPQAALPAVAAPPEAPVSAAFSPSDDGSASKPHQDILQVAVAQPADTTPPPAASAAVPAEDQNAAAAAGLAAAPRQEIGVIQASVGPSLVPRALPALPAGQASPTAQGPTASDPSGLEGPERIEGLAVAAAGAPAARQGPEVSQQAAAAGPAEAQPAGSDMAILADSGQEVASAGGPLAAGPLLVAAAPAPAPEEEGQETGSAAQVAGAPVQSVGNGLFTPSELPRALPARTVAFLDTDVLQPEASSPDSVSLITVSLKPKALTSQLYRAAPDSSAQGTPAAAPAEDAAAAGAASVQAPEASTAAISSQAPSFGAPVAKPPREVPLAAAGQLLAYAQVDAGINVRPSAYGSYSAVVNINAGQPTAFPPQPSVMAGVAEAPDVVDTRGFEAQEDSGPAAAASGNFGPVQAPSPGQRALAQLLSAASPATQPAAEDNFTSGYFDVWAAPAPCDGFFSVRARRSPAVAQAPAVVQAPSGPKQYRQGARPASRYGGGPYEAPSRVSGAPVASAMPSTSSAPAPSPERSLTLQPLGARTALIPQPPSPAQVADEPDQAAFAYAPSPAAAYHAGYYAGLQAAQAAVAAAAPANAPAESTAASVIAPAASRPIASPPPRRPAEDSRLQAIAQAPQRGAYGGYGAYSAGGVETRGSSFAYAPVVREYPLEGVPAPVAAPTPGTDELPPVAPAASYGSKGVGNYGYGYTAEQPIRDVGARYTRRPTKTAGFGQAFSPATQQAFPLPYAGYGAGAYPGTYAAFAVRPQAYYTPVQPQGSASLTPAPAPTVFLTGEHATSAPKAAPAPAAQATPAATPVPAPANAPAPSPQAAVSATPAGQPMLAPSLQQDPAPAILLNSTRGLSSALATGPAIAPEAAFTAGGPISSTPVLAPEPSVVETSPGKALAPSPAQAPRQPTMSTAGSVQWSCRECASFGAGRPPAVAMSVSDGLELAQFSTLEGVPSNVVYFVADIAFSLAPLTFGVRQISAANGTIIDVYPQEGCGRYVAKGYVQQPESGDPTRTDIVLTISDGAVLDCAGNAFPGSSLTSSILNRPTGALHTPSLKQSATGPVSNQSQVFLTLTFSQPVSSVSPADISVQLTQTQMPGTPALAVMPGPISGGQNRRRLIEASALAPAYSACTAEHSLTMLQQIDDSPQAVFEFLLDISDCFLGMVDVDFVGTVHNFIGAENLPVSTLQFWQMSADQRAGLSPATSPMHQ